MAKEMTLADIEALTKEFASARTEMMTVGETLNTELQAVRDRHAETLRKHAREANDLATRLSSAIDANRALFENKGAKSKVWDGIKVGLQKGKATISSKYGAAIDGADLYTAIGRCDSLGYEAAASYVDVRYVPTISALATLDDDTLDRIGLARTAGDDTPLVKPVDGEAAKVVDALIKQFIAE